MKQEIQGNHAQQKDLSPVATLSKIWVQYIHIDFNRDLGCFCRQYSDFRSEVTRSIFIKRAKYYHNIPGWPDYVFLGWLTPSPPIALPLPPPPPSSPPHVFSVPIEKIV